jgi:hypothetical protein
MYALLRSSFPSSGSSANLASCSHVGIDAELFDLYLRRYLIYAADLDRFLSICSPEYFWIRLVAYRARAKKVTHPLGCSLPRYVYIWGFCRIETVKLACPAANSVSDDKYCRFLFTSSPFLPEQLTDEVQATIILGTLSGFRPCLYVLPS